MSLASIHSSGTRSKKRHREAGSGDKDFVPPGKTTKHDPDAVASKGKRGPKPQRRTTISKPERISLPISEAARKAKLFEELDTFKDKRLVPDLQLILDKIRTIQDQTWQHLLCYYGDLDVLRDPRDHFGRAHFQVPKVRVLFRMLEFAKMHVQMFSDCGGDFYTVYNQRERKYENLPKMIVKFLDDVIEKGEAKKGTAKVISFKEWIRPGVWNLFRNVNKMVFEGDEDEEGRYVFRWVCI